jgi:uncharacterized protein (DUF2249 family)
MIIKADTRISDLIKENSASIDAIASLSKPLEKLKNPILRKLMASRVTIAEAAKMGGCTIEDFAKVLQPLGFEFDTCKKDIEDVTDKKPLWLENLPLQSIENLDVRDILAAGKDPLKQIMRTFKQVEPEHALCIINTFIPTPLVRLLEKEDVKTYTEKISDKEFHTYFYKSLLLKEDPSPSTPNASKQERVFMDDEARFRELCSQFDETQLKEIDVRHLEMPMPMQTILGELPLLADGHALYVNHKRIPIYLLEELADQDFQVHVWNIEENNVKLLIYKA